MNEFEGSAPVVEPPIVREDGVRNESVARHRRTAERALQIFVALIRQGMEIGLNDSEMALLFGVCDELRSLIAWLRERE